MKTKSRKAIAAVIGILEAALLACSVLLVQYVKEDLAPQVPEANAPAENGGMLIGEGEGTGVSLLSEKIEKADYEAYGVSPLAESAYTLTATVEPANAPDKAVDWSVAFVNPSSEWATGKTVTDYVTVTPTSDGALTATVQNLKAFGEQIKVTVTSRQNKDASANCSVDYAKRIVDVSVNFNNHYTITSTAETFQTELQLIPNVTMSPDNIIVNYTYSDYTVEDSFTMSVPKVQLNTAFVNAFKSKMSETTMDEYYQGFINSIEAVKTDMTSVWTDNMYIRLDVLGGLISNSFDGETYSLEDYIFLGGDYLMNLIIPVLSENEDMYLSTVEFTFSGTYSEFSFSAKQTVDVESLNYSVVKIDINDNSLIF